MKKLTGRQLYLQESLINYYSSRTPSLATPERCSEVYSQSIVCTSSGSDSSDTDEELSSEIHTILWDPWSKCRFGQNPWPVKERSQSRKFSHKDSKPEESELEGKLSQRIISSGLTHLEKSPYDEKYAYCKCQLNDKTLNDISELRRYHYIQYLNLSHNFITTLEALSEMPYLQYLDVSFNNIVQAFDFTPPLYLTTVNYSGNQIVHIPNLEKFWSIVNLDMSYNKIREIRGLQSLKYLTNLNLAQNKIRMLENLSNLNIETLILRENRICMFENEDDNLGFWTLDRLHTLDLAFNQLNTLIFLRKNYRLENLDMVNNEISELFELFYLKDLLYIKRLNFNNNSISDSAHFQIMCMRTFHRIEFLNDNKVTAEQKVEACTKADLSPLFSSYMCRTQLLLLDTLERSKIGAQNFPCNQLRPNVIAVIGPPASQKKVIVDRFLEESERLGLMLGIKHTTRKKRTCENQGKYDYFIEHEDFLGMTKRAEFIAVSEFNGCQYGITHKELEKGIDSIVVFVCDLTIALTLKIAGINVKLVLAFPQDESLHIKWAKDLYLLEDTGLDYSGLLYVPCKSPSNEVVSFPPSFAEDTFQEDSTATSLDLDESYCGFEDTLRDLTGSDDNEEDKLIFHAALLESPSMKSNVVYVDKDHHRVHGKDDCTDQIHDTKGLHSKRHKPGSIRITVEDENLYEDSILKKVDLDESKVDCKSHRSSAGSIQTHHKSGRGDVRSDINHHKYKLTEKSSEKTVSFHNFNPFDRDESLMYPRREHLRSISDAHVLRGFKSHDAEHTLFSVLSSLRIKERNSKTVYTSLTERMDALKQEKLAPFFKRVSEQKNMLLELHWENPGLFHTVIFTDKPKDCINSLNDIARSMKSNLKASHNYKDENVLKNHPDFQNVIKKRLANMKLNENPFSRIYEELKI